MKFPDENWVNTFSDTWRKGASEKNAHFHLYNPRDSIHNTLTISVQSLEEALIKLDNKQEKRRKIRVSEAVNKLTQPPPNNTRSRRRREREREREGTRDSRRVEWMREYGKGREKGQEGSPLQSEMRKEDHGKGGVFSFVWLESEQSPRQEYFRGR